MWIKYPSRTKALSLLPKKFRRLLKRYLMQLITVEQAKKCLTFERFQYISDTNPLPESLYLLDSAGYAFLYWFIKGPEFEFLIDERIRKILKFVAGPVRNQLAHKICWAYVCCDLISATRLLHGLDKVFVPLSPMFLCRNVDPVQYEQIWQQILEVMGEDVDVYKEDLHCCFGSTLILGFLYAKFHGITREKPGEEEFNCCVANDFIPENEELFKIRDIFHYHTLEEAYERVKSGYPVASGLMCFEGWYAPENCEEMYVYNGPTPETPYCYEHAVIITDFTVINGVKVAICKSSYGEKFATGGYFAVNLERMVTAVGVSRENGVTPKYCYRKPQYLLNEFYSVDVEVGSEPLITVDPDQAKKNMKFKLEVKNDGHLLAPIYQRSVTGRRVHKASTEEKCLISTEAVGSAQIKSEFKASTGVMMQPKHDFLAKSASQRGK